ncbi:uncharacterized protein ZK1073.1-like [Limulus polyphemus]|uniref:Uncharacterized protein ZK1073.1-like n=1 Tax=Limulus polyphemus TaxID=6850 RepID=A0ABM1SVT8_LIMPO|nr:uncharacterized protein ZK1073.1-like [Limulus polyphemus]
MSDAQLLEEPQITYDVEETRHEIKTERCGIITVFVMGSTKGMTDNTPVFLTVHDMGCNHTEFHSFTEHPSMARIKSRSVFIHVEIPGQEHDAPDLPVGHNFPYIGIQNC